MPYPNYYYPNMYQPVAQPTMSQNNAQTSNVQWVQGEASAKSYPVAPNNSVLLMDSEESVFYIKSTDQSGMPLPLRIFDYSERKSQNTEANIINRPNDFVSRSEFDAFKEDISKMISSNTEKNKKVSEEKSNV